MCVVVFLFCFFPFSFSSHENLNHTGGCAHGGNSGRLHRSSAHLGPRCAQQNRHQRAQHHSTFCPGEDKTPTFSSTPSVLFCFLKSFYLSVMFVTLKNFQNTYFEPDARFNLFFLI